MGRGGVERGRVGEWKTSVIESTIKIFKKEKELNDNREISQ